VSIPLRIFDRNQGEKALTQIDIGRNERLRDAAEAQVFNDVDSAYWTLVQNVNLLKPYKTRYLKLATDTRDRVSFPTRMAAHLCWIIWMRRRLIATLDWPTESDWFILDGRGSDEYGRGP
jgi:hypothetical protein